MGNDENNENNKARMDFLSVSSSSSISSSESQSQNKIAAAASLDNKDDKNNTVKQSQNNEDETQEKTDRNNSFGVSSYDFNNDLEAGLGDSMVSNNNSSNNTISNDDETATALPTTPIKKRNQSIDESAASRRNKKILIALAIVLGIVFGLAASKDNDNSDDNKTDEPTPPAPIEPPNDGDSILPPALDVKWNPIHTIKNATGASSMSDKGDVIAYNLQNDELYFYYFDTNVAEKSLWSAPDKTTIIIPGTDECMVKIILDDSEGVINVKENDGNGVWTSRADKAVGLTIQSASITEGCNQIVVGVPSYNETGIDAGMVRVYNVQPKELIPFGNDIFGEEGYRTGDSVSISNTGKIL